MNWEDTVLPDELIRLSYELRSQPPGHPRVHEDIAIAQAKATWDTAFKAGIREVVKWINSNPVAWGNITPDPYPTLTPLRNVPEWRSFLREKGIDGEKGIKREIGTEVDK